MTYTPDQGGRGGRHYGNETAAIFAVAGRGAVLWSGGCGVGLGAIFAVAGRGAVLWSGGCGVGVGVMEWRKGCI